MNDSTPYYELCFYHWSPRERRRSIERLGLVPGKLSRDHFWRPPYVAFCDEPVLAWQLSGKMDDSFVTWDLWMVFACDTGSYEVIYDTFPGGGTYVKEYRVYRRIYKRDVIWVAERTND